MSENKGKKQPVVVLVGHIDHGKSSILEKIKDLRVLERESGGITQHIRAYEVEKDDERATFIDTPGHAAFVEMRARGAKIADLAVLVVAADQGVEVQTKEAIRHLKEAELPFVVAINKMDKPDADPGRIKEELAKEEVVVEDKGGEVPVVETSAETGKGIERLVEIIFLMAEMEDFRAEQGVPAQGAVIESHLSAKRGPLAALLVREGVLKKGEIVATPTTLGRIKKMEDFQGKEVREAAPGQPALVLGFNELPRVGEEFRVCSCLAEAKKAVEQGEICEQNVEVETAQGKKKTLNVILKTDVIGSVQPVKRVLSELPQDKVALNLIKAEVGEVGLNDIRMAETCEAVILGFRVQVPDQVKQEAERARVGIFNFDVIYELKTGVKRMMEGRLGPQKVRVNLAKLKSLVVFKTTARRQVVGVSVERGEVRKGNKMEVFRPDDEGEVDLKPGEGIGEGRVVNVQRNKKDIKSGKEGEEVGILYEGRGEKIKEGDILVAYEIREKKVKL